MSNSEKLQKVLNTAGEKMQQMPSWMRRLDYKADRPTAQRTVQPESPAPKK